MKEHERKEHERKADDPKADDPKADDHTEFHELDAADRAGKVLTGAERGRLADLRKADILASVAAMHNPGKAVETATIPSHSREHRK